MCGKSIISNKTCLCNICYKYSLIEKHNDRIIDKYIKGLNKDNLKDNINKRIYELINKGITYEDIGKELNISKDAVRMRYNRYIKRNDIKIDNRIKCVELEMIFKSTVEAAKYLIDNGIANSGLYNVSYNIRTKNKCYGLTWEIA